MIDKKKMWYGSINYMGYVMEEECVVRFFDEYLMVEMLDVLYGEWVDFGRREFVLIMVSVILMRKLFI